jgi:hypothetical protein
MDFHLTIGRPSPVTALYYSFLYGFVAEKEDTVAVWPVQDFVKVNNTAVLWHKACQLSGKKHTAPLLDYETRPGPSLSAPVF